MELSYKFQFDHILRVAGIMVENTNTPLKQLVILFGCLLHAGYAQGPSSPIVRLVDGTSSFEGRVEIYVGGIWGTVCDDDWDDNDAKVVCNMLGISGRAQAVREAHFGQGYGTIHLDEVRCIGNENSLLTCGNLGLGSHDCDHSEDAGVRCGYGPPSSIVRLVDGTSTFEGRVEIYISGFWGTVCDDQWDDNDARVVCSMLGISGQAKGVTGAYYGQGYGLIHMDDVRCTGNENSLLMCGHIGSQQENCDHSKDAGVACGISVSVCGHRAWTYFDDINFCYGQFYQQNSSWNEARQACKNFGGDLVSLHSPGEHAKAVRLISENPHANRPAWIGLHYTGSDVRQIETSVMDRRASWQWVDGSRPNDGFTSGWQEWYIFSPSFDDDYGYMKSGYWYSTGGAERLDYTLCGKGPWSRILGSSVSSTSTLVTTPTSTPVSSSTSTSSTAATKQSTIAFPIATVQESFIDPHTQVTSTTPSVSQTSKPECLGNQWQYSEPANCCYLLQTSSNAISWDEAEKRCKAIDAHLASPSTLVQHDAVVNFTRQANLSDTDVWIGLWHNSGASGQEQTPLRQGWKWLDGSTYSFEAWSQEEPEEGERYARLKQGKWYGTVGSYSLFLCQKEPVSPVSGESSTRMDESTEPGTSMQLAFLALLVIPVLIAVITVTVYLIRKHMKKDDGENGENATYCVIEESDSRPSPSSEAHPDSNSGDNLGDKHMIKWHKNGVYGDGDDIKWHRNDIYEHDVE